MKFRIFVLSDSKNNQGDLAFSDDLSQNVKKE